MARKLIASHIIVGLLTVVSPVVAAPPEFVEKTVVPAQQTVSIPLTAAQVADNVFFLGTASDPSSGEVVQGYAIVHYERGAKESQNTAVTSAVEQCYTFLAEGAKWKVIEPWVVNAANRRGLAGSFVLSNLTSDIAKWEDAADGVMGSGSIDILGNGTLTAARLKADFGLPDGKNEVYFANVSSPGAIAVTVVWGIFSGPVENRKLVEWDQVYDDRDYNWSGSASGEAGKMDFENIATHELGHSVGLGDLYNSCTEETMYGYASYGEINKRDLNTGDIAGVNALY